MDDLSTTSHATQLELFRLERQSHRPRRPDVAHPLHLQLRYDQVILMVVGGLLGVTILFAAGVERGKQLARTEQPLLTPQLAAEANQTPHEALPSHTSTPQPVGVSPSRSAAQGQTNEQIKVSAPTQAVPPQKAPTRVAEEPSQYAIQVVTYTRSHLARQELQRLQTSGEQAFLIIRDGRTVVYVGPFTSKSHAAKKLAALKTHYRDCFVKSL